MADLWTVAVGTTGIVTPVGHITYSAAIPSWTGVDLAERLREMFPCEVLIENDSRLVALAESRRGVARGSNDVVRGVGAIDHAVDHLNRQLFATGAGPLIPPSIHLSPGSAGQGPPTLTRGTG
ncbi:ROK family protein [Nonomuraea sp. NPDC059194]|uniref:ROK family protein n=1 Tax=Nonomuraea sp. NPDC059194 TaxID=3346764 RepID=UPI0036A54ECC